MPKSMKTPIDMICVVVSRDEIMRQDTAPALSTLKKLLASPEVARTYKERVDLAIDGYNDDVRELDEIPEVRQFIQSLDSKFPFWLFFLSKYSLGLQCVVFCHLLPGLTDSAKAIRHPRQLEELLTKRWFPALNQIAEYAGISEAELERMSDRLFLYLKIGRLRIPDSE